ncbi:TetR/AcrR family transcriptional regulator [Actinomadura kijaniata]|uniref:TetR/AcrR family transcriptional regulator n=1 Tax=Actinomadura kijaniata TaxID=46161 RepID=UPI0008377851|nr:TetR/AcrR family transcriptional regulator [Actinomadura kijaniata]
MPKTTSAQVGRPPKFSRAEIVAAAGRIVAAEGVARLTMRRLAREIGGTPMALYHHVRDKEELLLLLLDDHAERMPRPDLPDDPLDRIVTVAAAIRDGLADCPWIVEVLTADDLMSEAALWYVEHIVAAAVEAGLSPERAVHAYRAIWHYTAGDLIVRTAAARRRADDERPTRREEVFADLDAVAYPHLARVADRWEPLTEQDTYRRSLRALAAGLLAAG